LKKKKIKICRLKLKIRVFKLNNNKALKWYKIARLTIMKISVSNVMFQIVFNQVNSEKVIKYNPMHNSAQIKIKYIKMSLNYITNIYNMTQMIHQK
jgi:hypothetical protein